jgi:hypothetical protein
MKSAIAGDAAARHYHGSFGVEHTAGPGRRLGTQGIRDMAVGQATHNLEVRARLVRRILVAQQPASASILPAGQCVMLASVRFLTCRPRDKSPAAEKPVAMSDSESDQRA